MYCAIMCCAVLLRGLMGCVIQDSRYRHCILTNVPSDSGIEPRASHDDLVWNNDKGWLYVDAMWMSWKDDGLRLEWGSSIPRCALLCPALSHEVSLSKIRLGWALMSRIRQCAEKVDVFAYAIQG
ncbi:uncharacterized protein BDR25DRAFT_68583 [Lindgomyces ingoldianus]|uniref:Uncharacterized protein n=1 Tax=Lindgomyces ingoldianus TaxID=673940 RepID=A0ACB6RCA7_9PLEO|nr:uncharacterized protein BDR25DRAFT_68583 [Lindgomyces ingoldianus]KAF2476732.1 hypothetical protein BDR25DRAFT_68583 [Lindgomyces ingoldianus]